MMMIDNITNIKIRKKQQKTLMQLPQPQKKHRLSQPPICQQSANLSPLSTYNDYDKDNYQAQSSIQANENPNDKDTHKQQQMQGKPVKKKKKKKLCHGLVANLIDTQYAVVKKVVASMLGMKVIRESGTEEWDLYWTDNAVSSETVSKLKPYQKINHFPGMYTLSRKNYLARNLIKMQKKFPNDYNFFPKTWVLPSNYMQSEPNTVVIAKPQASSQGRGIFLSKSVEDFQFGEHYVVQKYLKKPFLIDGLKFDLRVYVLVAGCDPLRVYVYKEGLARFATQPYCVPKKQNLNNHFMHLTNYAINKNNQKFQYNSSATQMNKGHKRSLTSILHTLSQLGHNPTKIWFQIKSCITKTLLSAQPLLSHQYRSAQPNNYANNICFQVLGFDIILDHNLKPQVLEVNYTPSFTTDTPLDVQIKKNLIYDSLVLVNVNSKAKAEIISQKKKEMKERTLTGKNFHQREARQSMVNKAQIMRNIWESQNMGNFDRAYPVIMQLPEKVVVKLQKNASKQQQYQIQANKQKEQDPQLKQLQQKYRKFLQYSLQSYQNNTGANIRRNVKVLPHTNSAGQGMSFIAQQVQSSKNTEQQQTITSIGKNTIMNKPQKYTNTQNLQKIYKSKFRPMIYKKVSQTAPKTKNPGPKQQQDHMKTPLLSKNISEEQQPSRTKVAPNPYLSSFAPMNTNANMHLKHKSANSSYADRGKVLGTADGKYKKKDAQMAIMGNGNGRTASEFKKGLSTVYNVTFVEKKR